MEREQRQAVFLGSRHYFVLLVLVLLLSGLVGRALYLQIVEQDFLESQGVQRQIRTIRRRFSVIWPRSNRSPASSSSIIVIP